MDDVRAVMDAAARERAAVVGVSEGGPMCALFAATHPGSHAGAGDAGRLRAAQLGAGLSDRAPPGAGRLAAADAPSSGARTPRAGSWPSGRRRSPTTSEAIEWYASYLVARREPVGGGGDHRHERGDRRAPGARHGARAVARHAPRGGVPARRPAATWASGCRARGSSSVPASTTCRGRATRSRCSPRSSRSSASSADAPVEPGADPHDGARGRAARDAEPGLCDSALSALPRPRARRAARPGPRELRRPGPRASAARPRSRTSCPRCAPASTPASASCTTARLTGAALESPPSVAGAAAPGRDPRHLDRAGPRRRLGHRLRRARHGHARGRRCAAASASLALTKGDSPLGFGQQHQPWVRAPAPKRRLTPETAATRALAGGADEQPLVGLGAAREQPAAVGRPLEVGRGGRRAQDGLAAGRGSRSGRRAADGEREPVPVGA